MRWFVFSSDAPPVIRSNRIRTGARLTLESLEERRCLAADMEIAGSNCSQLPRAEKELSQFESAQQVASYSTETSSVPSERCVDNQVDRGRVEDAFGSGTASTNDQGDTRKDALGDEDENLGKVLDEETFATDFATETNSNDPRTNRISNTFAGPADLANASQELAVNAFDSTTPQEAVSAPTPTIQPNRAFADSRPLIQPIESLQVLPNATINLGQMREEITPQAFLEGASTARIGVEGVGFQFGKLTVPFHVEASKTDANTLVLKPKYESERPSISAVTALMPGPEPFKTKQIADVATRGSELLVGLIPLGVAQVCAKFIPIEEEVEGAATSAIFPEILGEPQEEKPAESINPLFFVVLVGLIGFAKPDKFRLIRKNGTRDNSPIPGPITVVPLVNELEPWPKTTLVKRNQDETI